MTSTKLNLPLVSKRNTSYGWVHEKKLWNGDTLVPPHHQLPPASFSWKERGWSTAVHRKWRTKPSHIYYYPQSLFPSAMEQLREAKITKLDLHSIYNLIHICKGDEWKTDFSTTSVHFKYCVSLYGLSSASQSSLMMFSGICWENLHHLHRGSTIFDGLAGTVVELFWDEPCHVLEVDAVSKYALLKSRLANK